MRMWRSPYHLWDNSQVMNHPSDLEYFVKFCILCAVLAVFWSKSIRGFLFGWMRKPKKPELAIRVWAEECVDNPNEFLLHWDSPGTNTLVQIYESMEMSRDLEVRNNQLVTVVRHSSSTNTIEGLPSRGSKRMPLHGKKDGRHYMFMSDGPYGKLISGSLYIYGSGHFKNLRFSAAMERNIPWIGLGLCVAAVALAQWLSPGSTIAWVVTRVGAFFAGLIGLSFLHNRLAAVSKWLAYPVTAILALVWFILTLTIQVSRP